MSTKILYINIQVDNQPGTSNVLIAHNRKNNIA